MGKLARVLCAVVVLFVPVSLTGAAAAPASKAPAIHKLSSSFGLTAGGKSVTITGSGFRGTTKVTFGGIATTFTASSTSIVAKTPARAAGLVEVKVYTSAGSNIINSNSQFVYHVQAPTTATVRVNHTPGALLICQVSPCGSVTATTAGFSGPVWCKVTGSEYPAPAVFWTQGANESKPTGIIAQGTWVEVTCDGVVGRNTTWPS